VGPANLPASPLLYGLLLRGGLLYEDEGQPEKATREYEAVVRAQPSLKSAHYRLSRLYASGGHSEEARKELEFLPSLAGK
jgi:tetratricopeptide (TPR) repeat protein